MTQAMLKRENTGYFMSYNKTITPCGEYVDVKVSGIATYANAVDLWESIASVCEEQKCFKVLGEQNVLNPLSTTEAYKHRQIFFDAGIDSRFKIAWVDLNPRTLEVTNFIRTVLHNRDIGYGKIFSDTVTAKEWLLNDTNS